MKEEIKKACEVMNKGGITKKLVDLSGVLIGCNLRRTAATGAFASGHPAEPNGHLH